jgi:BASS family bile acid:Na+ symporter
MKFLSKIVPIAMLLFVVSSMLAVGLGLTIPEILAPLRNVKLVLFALIANFVLMPLAALLISRMLQLDEPLGVGLLLLGSEAGAPFVPKLAGVAKSNLAFAVGLMVLLMVLTVAYMPLVLPLLLEGVSVDPVKIARSLLLLMLLPLGVGLAIRAQLPRLAERAQPPLNRISGLSLMLLIGLMLITNIKNVISLFGTRGLLTSVLFLFCGVAVGWLLGGANLETRGVLSLGTAQRNIAAAMLVGG